MSKKEPTLERLLKAGLIECYGRYKPPTPSWYVVETGQYQSKIVGPAQISDYRHQLDVLDEQELPREVMVNSVELKSLTLSEKIQLARLGGTL